MEILVFSLNAIFVYLFSDWIIRKLEEKRGAALRYRQLVFFVVFLVLVMLTFQFMKSVLAAI
jgi:hypothetical protein